VPADMKMVKESSLSQPKDVVSCQIDCLFQTRNWSPALPRPPRQRCEGKDEVNSVVYLRNPTVSSANSR